jgi:hypothetical protein
MGALNPGAPPFLSRSAKEGEDLTLPRSSHERIRERIVGPLTPVIQTGDDYPPEVNG